MNQYNQNAPQVPHTRVRTRRHASIQTLLTKNGGNRHVEIEYVDPARLLGNHRSNQGCTCGGQANDQAEQKDSGNLSGFQSHAHVDCEGKPLERLSIRSERGRCTNRVFL